MSSDVTLVEPDDPPESKNKRPIFAQWGALCFSLVNNLPLVLTRIAFGLIMLIEVIRYWSLGAIDEFFIQPKFHASYYGFEWVKPFSGNAMYVYFGMLGAAAFCIMIGCFYRLAALMFAIGFSYLFLMDSMQFRNHWYFIVLMSWIMVFLPAHRRFSVDTYRNPTITIKVTEAWKIWLLQFQVAVVYIFGGINKLNLDWFQGEPMRTWLHTSVQQGRFEPGVLLDSALYGFIYGGIAIDLLIIPALLWKYTRISALIFMLIFHLFNAWFFQIGIFPWMMIALTFILFTPIYKEHTLLNTKTAMLTRDLPLKPFTKSQRKVLALLIIYAMFQIAFPFRHHFYPGNVRWNEQGLHFSWMMMAKSKNSSGPFLLVEPTSGSAHQLSQEELDHYLLAWQQIDIRSNPEWLRQFAVWLAEQWKVSHPDASDLEVHCWPVVALNGRKHQLIIHPEIDLTSVQNRFSSNSWIKPLTEEFRNTSVSLESFTGQKRKLLTKFQKTYHAEIGYHFGEVWKLHFPRQKVFPNSLLQEICQFSDLRELTFESAPITDYELNHLLRLRKLTYLSIPDSQFSKQAKETLHTSLPNCLITTLKE
jgi:vitamin K-dependent gamma-carboxylase